MKLYLEYLNEAKWKELYKAGKLTDKSLRKIQKLKKVINKNNEIIEKLKTKRKFIRKMLDSGKISKSEARRIDKVLFDKLNKLGYKTSYGPKSAAYWKVYGNSTDKDVKIKKQPNFFEELRKRNREIELKLKNPTDS